MQKGYFDGAFAFSEKEDGESASDWAVYDQSPAGASVSSVENTARRSNVIFCDGSKSGSDTNGFVIGDREGSNFNPNGVAWDDPRRVLSFWYRETFDVVYVAVSATDGQTEYHQFLAYLSWSGTNYQNGDYVYFYLGSGVDVTTWTRFERNVAADWESVAATSWNDTDGVFIRPDGDFYIDDIRLSNSMTKTFNALKGGSIGQIACEYTLGSFPSKTERWLHYDRLGNVMNRTNESGTTTDTFHQDAYGNILSSVTTGAWASSMSGRHLTTKEYDTDAGLYYFWQRWYDPQVGRFVSKAEFPPVLEHSFSIAKENPARYLDLNGFLPVESSASDPIFDECVKQYLEIGRAHV